MLIFSYSLNTYTSSVDRISKVLFRPSVDSYGLHMATTLHEGVFKLWSPYNLSENNKSNYKIIFKVIKINVKNVQY